MEWDMYLLFVLVLAQMLRTNLTLSAIQGQLEGLTERQAIVIMPINSDDIDPMEYEGADSGSLTDLVKQWDES
tara:strand:+ start:273 stop:491 length:219 start_codon:yes stop_codon:yes gene_type:complete